MKVAVWTSGQLGLLSVIGPVTAQLGTLVVIVVSLTTLNVAVTLSANLTAVTPVRFEPVMVTLAPTVLLKGLTPKTVGHDGCEGGLLVKT